MSDENTNLQRTTSQEPLLGRMGAVEQHEDSSIWRNLIIGTGVLAQVGLVAITVVVWTAIFSHPILMPFALHPTLNSVGILLLFESALLLQPTHTAQQKKNGAVIHSIINGFAAATFLAALIIIIYNKNLHNGKHFESPHAILGLTTYILLLIQATIGFTQFYTPSLYGGVDNAKAMYKYHRISGYLISVMLLVTVAAATQTTYNVNVLHMKLWHVVLAGIVILAGVLPRVKKQKLGIAPRTDGPPRLQ